MYKCGICGKEYGNIDDYVKCVVKCSDRVEREEKESNRKRLEAEKSKREEEIRNARNHLAELISKYQNDYHPFYKMSDDDILNQVCHIDPLGDLLCFLAR